MFPKGHNIYLIVLVEKHFIKGLRTLGWNEILHLMQDILIVTEPENMGRGSSLVCQIHSGL